MSTNDDYLAAAMTWLRSLLDAEASGDTRTQAAEAINIATAVTPTPLFVQLTERLGLNAFERNVLLLAVAMELDTRIPTLCAQAQHDPSKPYPTFALAFAIFDEPLWDALSPERPLRYWRLLEIHQLPGQPLTTSSIRADERVVNAAKGLQHLDDRLAPFLFPLDLPHDHVDLPPSTEATMREIADVIVRMRERTPLLQLIGTDPEMKQLVAARAAGSLGLHIARLPADLLPASPSDVESLARLWNREAMLLPLALYIDANSDEPNPSLKRFLLRVNGVTFVDARETPAANVRTFEVAKPTPVEQRELWSHALGEHSTSDAALLSGQFDLGIPRIRRIAAEAAAEAEEERAPRAWRLAQLHTRPKLDALAQRVDCKATWDDIILPDADLRLLRRIAGQVRQRLTVYDEWGFRAKMNRGLGISALFIGESGTGKTMAAEVIANALQLNLYRVDLSSVINKYIGETEKNLRRVFDAADDGGAILFFDEAEALFGKRVESRDSNDRHANAQIAYLLQRIEAYPGLVILATNKRTELDNAFLRRIRFAVTFPFPGTNERRELWRKALPAQVPVAALDVDRLAQLKLAGGSVHNVALNASFAAADQSMPVTMGLLFEAARAELRKLEKPINESELLWKDGGA
jgi:hypothetical protein